MTKEQLSIKITKLGLIIGVCGGVAQALGFPGHTQKSLIIGLLIGFAITLHEWRKVAVLLFDEYKCLKKMESDKKQNGCSEK